MQGKIVGFNYAALGAKGAAAQKHATAIRGLLERTGAAVVEIGRRLIEARDLVGPRHFQAWLQVEFKWTQPVASNFMIAARRFDGLDCLDRFQPSALYLLARNKIEDATAEEAIKQARRGELITLQRAKEIVQQRQPAIGKRHREPDDRGSLRKLLTGWSDRIGRDQVVRHLQAILAELQEEKPTQRPLVPA